MSKKRKKKSKRRPNESSAPVDDKQVSVPLDPAPEEATPEFPRWSLWTILAASVVGMGLGLYASYQTLQIHWQGAVNPSACSVNSWINCDAAHASSAAFLFGLPVAWWGFLYYLWSGGLVFWALVRGQKGRLSLVAAYLSCFVAVGFTLIKAFTLFQLKVLCLICLSMYLVNFTILLSFQKAIGFSREAIWHFIRESFYNDDTKAKLAWLRPSILYITTAGVLIVGGLFLAQYVEASYYDTQKIDVAAEVRKHFDKEKINATLHPEAAVWGNPDAAVTLMEFSDFQCPYCKRAAFHLRGLLWEFRDQVRLYFMHFPLDHKINRFVRGPIHEYAGLAARAAVYAQERGKFWEFHDELFRGQESLDRDFILALSRKFGWDQENFVEFVNAADTYQRVRDEIDCSGDKVRSTPTLIINGRSVEYWGHPEVVQAIIKEEIRRSEQ